MKRFDTSKLQSRIENIKQGEAELDDQYNLTSLLEEPELRRVDIFYKPVWITMLTTTKGSTIDFSVFSTEEGAIEFKKAQEKNKGCEVVIKKATLNCTK